MEYDPPGDWLERFLFYREKSEPIVPVSTDVYERTVEALERDVVATLGEVHRHTVRDHAAIVRTFADASRFGDKLVEDVQQYFMDTFVDTSWPACPRHPAHPLWLVEGVWCCDDDEAPLAALGELSSLRS